MEREGGRAGGEGEGGITGGIGTGGAGIAREEQEALISGCWAGGFVLGCLLWLGCGAVGMAGGRGSLICRGRGLIGRFWFGWWSGAGWEVRGMFLSFAGGVAPVGDGVCVGGWGKGGRRECRSRGRFPVPAWPAARSAVA